VSAERAENQHRLNTAGLRPPWKPGQSGNPKGRPPGARQLIENDFLNDAYQDWKKDGRKSFRALAKKDPHSYLRLIAEVGRVIKPAGSERATEQTGAVQFDPATFIAGVAVGRTVGNHQVAVSERSVLSAEICDEPAGCTPSMDTGPLSRDPE
jgi:hypothetical protein